MQWGTNASSYLGYPTFNILIDISNLYLHAAIKPNFNINVDLDSPDLRIRVIRYKNGSSVINFYRDYKVIKKQGNILYIEDKNYQTWIGKMTMFEIYEDSKTQSNDVYYEIAETFEIGTDVNGNKYHKGLIQDQDPLNLINTPAAGTFRSGDVYFRVTDTQNDAQLSGIFDDSVSDYYDSEVSNIGRPGAINPDAKQSWKPTQLRHSNKFIPDSNINGLSYFDAEGFNPLPIEYGAINKLILSSNVLMSIHEFRWVSNYIEESIMRKQDGTDQLIAASSVFGGFRAPDVITGTINQESVQEYMGNIFAYDMNKGIVTRFGADGLNDVTNKMGNYFSQKTKELLSSKSVFPIRVISAYDSDNSEYMLTFPAIYTKTADPSTPSIFKDTLVINPQTISYSETIKRWITFYSFIPEIYGRIDLNLISFKDGKLWVHESTNIHNNFYNEQFTSQIEVGFNDKPGQVKVYKALGVESYHPWEAISVKTPNGMETIIYKGRFVKKEDSFFAPVMKDLNSDGFPSQNDAILNGRDLRDRTVTVLLENDEISEVVLFSVSMLSILSARHQK